MKVIIAGDFCPSDRVAKLIDSGKGREALCNVVKVIDSAHYAIVNLECPVVDDCGCPIPKSGPRLKCTSKSIGLLKEVGFDCVTLANNHFRDYGDKGVSNTIRWLEETGVKYVGGGKNLEDAEKSLIVSVDNKTIAVINACEHEFSIASANRGGSNPLNVVRVAREIINARNKTDFVLVIIHGGNEYYQLPSPRMKELYRFFVELGADAVVNHHQHCFSGFEVYQGKPIFYGLGNFCFDLKSKRNSTWNEGYMVCIDFNEEIKYNLIPYNQCDNEAKIVLLQDEDLRVFYETIDKLNDVIRDTARLEYCYAEFCKKRKKSLVGPFTAYLTKYAYIAAAHRLLPYLWPVNKMIVQLNCIQCESHRDVLVRIMHDRFEKM